MRFALICAAWPAFCAAAFAQEDDIAVERPFLWQMQSPGSDQVSHLFGTIHVNHPGITRLHPKAQSAFDACDAAYFEIDFVRDNDAQVKAVSLPEGQTLEQLVSTRAVERIDLRLKKLSPLLARRDLPEFHVVLWPIMLANLEAQVRYLGTMPLDLQLHQAAGKAGKVTGGLEDPLSQLKVLTSLPLEQQIEFLEASLDVMEEDDRRNRDSLGELVRLYASGDERKLEEYLKRELRRPAVSDEVRNTFITSLLTDRNRRIAAAIDARVRERPQHSLFVAIGAAHLIGTDTVISGLEKRGYRIQRITVDGPDRAR